MSFLRRYLLITLLLQLLMLGCNQKNVSTEDFDEDKLVAFIVEFEMAKAFLKSNVVSYDEIDRRYLLNSIYEKHNLSEDKFEDILQTYPNGIEGLEKVYDRVLTILNEKKVKVDKLNKLGSNEKD